MVCRVVLFQQKGLQGVLCMIVKGITMASKYKQQMESTDSNYVYKRSRKRYLDGRGISCVYCDYHQGENLDHKYQRSWKKFRKTRYKTS